MKKLLLIAISLTMSLALNAQVKTPQPSPFSKVEQKVGLTDVSIEYSRPSMKERTIFGGLVPYGELWRTGANKNTIITFSDEFTFANQAVKPGSYAIFTKPNEDSWIVFLYSDTKNWGKPEKWDDEKVVAKISVKVQEIPFDVQTFTIDINNLTNVGGTIDMMWEKTYISIPFVVPTDYKVVSSINEALSGDPTFDDYYAAAVYYLQEDKDINQAKEWMNEAMSMTDELKFWQLRQKSLIHAKAGDKAGAIKAAKASLAGAEKAGNADFVKMNKDSLAEWMK